MKLNLTELELWRLSELTFEARRDEVENKTDHLQLLELLRAEFNRRNEFKHFKIAIILAEKKHYE